MELIASLRDQLNALCADPATEPDWLLSRLSQGLRERYGRFAVGFARGDRAEDGRLQLLGLCDPEGQTVLEPPRDFRPGRRHGFLDLAQLEQEIWFDARLLGSFGDIAVDAVIRSARSAFLVPWLIDRPADWLILILSPLAGPSGQRNDRGLAVNVNLLATNLLRALDARRLDRANAWIRREMEEIARLQKLLQPDELTELRGVEIAVSAEIYQYAGGDYFDVPRLTHLVPEPERHPEQDHWGVIIADVSGHGPSAAMEAAMLDAIARTYDEPLESGSDRFLGYLNQHLFSRKPRASFITAFAGTWWPGERCLEYACAGHPPPLLRQAGRNRFRPLEVPADIPLRIETDYRYRRSERVMDPGDVLILFTDGVTEARDASGTELGSDGLAALVPGSAQDAQAVLEALLEGLERHSSGGALNDDQTLIVIRFG